MNDEISLKILIIYSNILLVIISIIKLDSFVLFMIKPNEIPINLLVCLPIIISIEISFHYHKREKNKDKIEYIFIL